MVDEFGRKISDELFQPTKATRLSVVPQYIERSAKPLAQPYPEAYITEGVKMSKSMMEELKREGAQVLFRGKGNAAINNLDRAIRAEDLSVATMKILEPNLIGCGASSMNQLRVVGKSRMCSCLAQEVLHPDQPKLLMVWSMGDLLNIGMSAPEGKLIPFLFSAYLPLVFMMNHQNLRPPTRHLIVTLNHSAYTLVQCYSTLVGVPDQLQTIERRRMCEADRRAHMMAEIYDVASKFHLKYKDVFDRMQMGWGKKAFCRTLRVHHDPATGGCRPWLESKVAYRKMTKVQHKEVDKQLVRYEVPRALREVFCQGEKKTQPEGTCTDLPHDMQEMRKRIWKKREEEADRRRDVELKQRMKFKGGVIRANLANEIERTVYPLGFVRRPVISTQEDDVAWEPVSTAATATSATTSGASTSEQRAGGAATSG